MRPHGNVCADGAIDRLPPGLRTDPLSTSEDYDIWDLGVLTLRFAIGAKYESGLDLNATVNMGKAKHREKMQQLNAKQCKLKSFVICCATSLRVGSHQSTICRTS